jgi:hypothetical protein
VAALWRRRGDDVRMHREVDRMIYDAPVCWITRWIATGAENAEVRTIRMSLHTRRFRAVTVRDAA